MLLRIQPEESLRSYIDRNLLANFKDWTVDRLRWLSRGVVTYQGAKEIASLMGWEGCYGFNRLMHEHTHLPLQSVIRDTRDITYSRTAYLKSRTRITDSDLNAYCPECVREDLQKMGFSYWRRNFPAHVTVCATHNVVLMSACPHCDKPFSSKGHNLDVMWRTCSGRHLGSAESVENRDADALKRAEFVEALCVVKSYIPTYTAAVILSDKLLRLEGLTRRMNSEQKPMLKLVDQILIDLESNDIDGTYSNLKFFSDEVLQVMIFAYNTFEEFWLELSVHDQDLIPIDSLWRNYGVGVYATSCRA